MENLNYDHQCVLFHANILVVVVAADIAARGSRRNRTERSVWVFSLLRQRQERGVWNSVIPDLVQGTGRTIDATFSNFFRIDERCFEDILSKCGPAITRQDTHLRPAGCTFTDPCLLPAVLFL